MKISTSRMPISKERLRIEKGHSAIILWYCLVRNAFAWLTCVSGGVQQTGSHGNPNRPQQVFRSVSSFHSNNRE